ncbi:MAG: hypothetical protein ACR2QX_06300 [Woeseiaceae bacterium]
MNRQHFNTGILPNVVLAALLIAAQLTVVLHDFEHDLGAPQSKVCSTCATASQLGSATVDGQFPEDADLPGSSFTAAAHVDFQSTRTIVVRQRGPPASL